MLLWCVPFQWFFHRTCSSLSPGDKLFERVFSTFHFFFPLNCASFYFIRLHLQLYTLATVWEWWWISFYLFCHFSFYPSVKCQINKSRDWIFIHKWKIGSLLFMIDKITTANNEKTQMSWIEQKKKLYYCTNK